MSEAHKQQIAGYYTKRLPFNYYGTQMDSIDHVMEQINESSWTEIPDEDVCVGHWNGFHSNVTRGAEIFITDRAIHVIQTGTLRRRKFLGSERILPSSITGVERSKSSNSSTGTDWAITISRTTERDTFSNLDEFTAKLLEETINGWKEKAATPPASSESPADTILKLKGLVDAGVLTQEEFDEKKKKLLDSI